MAKHAIVGSGSHMPIDKYLKKIEQTCIFEDPDQLENYHRNVLKDMRPDKPFFESDAPRYNNYSADRLNLRHCGRRSTAEPHLPDGTFLDHDFLIKDMRGVANEPDMRKHRAQQEARGKFIKFYNDADNSVPSAGRAPARVISDRVKGFYPLKNRLMIFDESKVGRHNGGTNSSKLTSTGICMQKTDQKNPEIEDAICYNRSALAELSNDTFLGWDSTTDHIFKIAKYSQTRINAAIEDQNWYKNRANVKVDHDVLLSWKDQNVPLSLSLKMIDMARKKHNDIESGKSVYLHTSKEAQTGRKKKLTADDLNALNRESQHSQARGVLIKSEVGNRLSKAQQLDSLHNKIVIDPEIAAQMSSINRKMGPREIKDLRESVVQSGEQAKVLIEQSNRRGANEVNDRLLWDSEMCHEKGKTMMAANYAKLNRYSTRLQDGAEFEQYKKTEKIAGQRRGELYNKQYGFSSAEYDHKNGHEADGVKLIGTMGSKYMRKYMTESGRELNGVNDISARNSY